MLREQLDRHPALQALVEREVHLRHAAEPESPFHPVASCDLQLAHGAPPGLAPPTFAPLPAPSWPAPAPAPSLPASTPARCSSPASPPASVPPLGFGEVLVVWV